MSTKNYKSKTYLITMDTCTGSQNTRRTRAGYCSGPLNTLRARGVHRLRMVMPCSCQGNVFPKLLRMEDLMEQLLNKALLHNIKNQTQVGAVRAGDIRFDGFTNVKVGILLNQIGDHNEFYQTTTDNYFLPFRSSFQSHLH